MTADTAQIGVRAIDAEIRLLVVIEGPDAPVIGRVAVGALVPQIALVQVIRTVAVDAFRGRALEFPVDVTGFTGGRCMQTDQREAAQVMIESQPALPGL